MILVKCDPFRNTDSRKSTDDKYLENFRCWASGFSVKSYTAINELLHSIFILHMVFGERGDALVKTIHLIVLTASWNSFVLRQDRKFCLFTWNKSMFKTVLF